MEWAWIDQIPDRLAACEAISASEFGLYVYVEGSYGATEHEAAQALEVRAAGMAGRLLGPRIRRGLFRVLDARQLPVVFDAVAEYCFVSIIGIDEALEPALVQAVREDQLGTSMPSRPSRLVALAGAGHRFLEVSTELDGGVDARGVDGTFLVLTWSTDLMPEVVVILESIAAS